MPLHPYLNVGSSCRQALTRHHDVHGGELDILAVSDLPAGEEPPLEATFRSPAFGHCVDRFGLGWMVNVEPPAGEA